MKRKIIEINEDLCNGCGNCINICAEAALELVNGKAKLVKDFFCDGMGACLDVCPTDALKVVEKESEEYDVAKTYAHVKEKRGGEAAMSVHGIGKVNQDSAGIMEKDSEDKPMKCGCPGSMMRDMRSEDGGCGGGECGDTTKIEAASALNQWPIQLHLLTPEAPYFQDADLVISADCVPFSYPNFHEKFLKGKTLIMFCPKLDSEQEIYLEKLTEIFKLRNIKSITLVHMEVPCCGGVGSLVEQALNESGKNIIIKDYTISIAGEIV
jgi:ferredoxin